MITLKHILVATDFSEASDAACAYGRELASRFGATLHVLHVVQTFPPGAFGTEGFSVIGPELQQQMEGDARRRLKDLVLDAYDGGPAITPAVVTAAAPAAAIIEYANEYRVDLIVMGTHGRGAFAHLLMGSVAERVVRLAACPVLTVKQPERDFVHQDALIAVAEA
jgi:nucleotide-binding universal stress UspA family protein